MPGVLSQKDHCLAHAGFLVPLASVIFIHCSANSRHHGSSSATPVGVCCFRILSGNSSSRRESRFRRRNRPPSATTISSPSTAAIRQASSLLCQGEGGLPYLAVSRDFLVSAYGCNLGIADYNSRVAGTMGASKSDILLQGGQPRPRSHCSSVICAIPGQSYTGRERLGRLANGTWFHSLSHWPE